MELGRSGKIALACVVAPAIAVVLYLLFKRDNEDDEDGHKRPSIITSRQTVIEVKVPKRAVGPLIGRQGANIKMIQEKSGARINFSDPQQNDQDRTCIIKGDQQSAAEAECLVRKAIADQGDIKETKMYIPKIAVGRVIGRGGDTIRNLQSTSKAKIMVGRSNSYEQQVLVTIRGSPSQIESAKGLISEKVAESEAFEAKAACLAANRQQRGKRRPDGRGSTEDNQSPSGPSNENGPAQPEVERLPDIDDFFHVFVSAISSPDLFWIQLLRTENMHLDPLVQDMTKYYGSYSEEHHLESFNVGDIIASPFPHDDLWYRARVIQILPDDMVELYFVDYGDSDNVNKSQLRQLRPEFQSLPYQAIECRLSGVQPSGGNWSDSAIDLFEQLTHVAQWKVINAKVIRFDTDIPQIRLIDTNGLKDVDISEELVRQGFASYDTEEDSGVEAGQGDASEVQEEVDCNGDSPS